MLISSLKNSLSESLKRLWFKSSPYKINGLCPNLIFDYHKNKYAINNTEYTFANSQTFTRASTATYVDAQGNIQTAAIDEPRFDYSTGSRGLLIEESRTNLTSKSDASDFTLTGTGEAVLTPLSLNALNIFDGCSLGSGGALWHRALSSPVFFTTGITYIISAWYMKGSSGKVLIQTYKNSSEFYKISGIIGSNSFTKQEHGCVVSDIQEKVVGYCNGEKVYKLTFKSVWDIDVNVKVGVGPYSSVVGEDIIVLGMQVEEGVFPTSYIPTNGSSVTRAKDALKISDIDTSDWFNNTEGVFYAELEHMGDTTGTSAYILDATDGTSANRILLAGSSTDADLIYYMRNGSSTQVSKDSGMDAVQTLRKAAIAFKDNDFALVVDGTTPFTDSAGTVPTVNSLSIGSSNTDNNLFVNGFLREIRFYSKRLSNEDMISLTDCTETIEPENITINNKVWVPQINEANHRYSVYQNKIDPDVISFELRASQPALSSDITNGRSRTELAGYSEKIPNNTLVSRKFSIVFLEQDTDHAFQIFYQIYDGDLGAAAVCLETRNGGSYLNLGIGYYEDGSTKELNIPLSSDGFEVGKRYDFYIETLLHDTNGQIYIEINDNVAYEAYGIPIGRSGSELAYDKFGIYREPQTDEGTTRTLCYDFITDNTASMDKSFNTSAEFNYSRGSITLTEGAFDIADVTGIVSAWDADTATKTYVTDEATGDVATIQETGTTFTSGDTHPAIYDATAFDNNGGLIASTIPVTYTAPSYDASSGWTIGIVIENGTAYGDIFGLETQYQSRLRQSGDGSYGSGTYWDDQEDTTNASLSTVSGKHVIIFRSNDNTQLNVAMDSFEDTHSLDPRGTAANSALDVALFNRAIGAGDTSLNLKIASFFMAQGVLSDADAKNWIGQKSKKYSLAPDRGS